MTTIKKPDFRTEFLSESEELNYLSDMIHFYLQDAHRPAVGMYSLIQRFHDILTREGLDDGSILLQGHWALLHEMVGNIIEAIPHREREIERIDRLFAIGGPVGPINQHFLISVLHTLRQDYLHVGDTEKAKAILERVKALEKVS